jgi:osmoprotectant transport system ATP-binding protein
MGHMITIEHIAKSYDRGESYAVRDLSLSIAAGEFLVLLGESGCGKTTTLKMINRLIEPTDGRILIDKIDTATVDPIALRRGIGYVFQGIGLFPHMTVAENIAAVPHLLGWEGQRTQRRVFELLELMQLPPDEFAHRSPADLSGGQRQRIGVARALAASPKLMLMDEPFGALDPITRDALQTQFKQLQKSLGLTVVMVTHDMTEALILADRIAVMAEGRILRLGTPHELLTDPQHEYVTRLLASPKRQADIVERLIEGEQQP